MKKTYQKPEIETAELHLHTAIMSTPGDNTPPTNPVLLPPAPKRRLF